MKGAGRLALLLAVALVVLAMVVPNTALAFLRHEWPWLSQSMSRMERIWPAIDLAHVVAFGVLGFVGGIAAPWLGARRSLLALALLAVATEVLQFWVPGRTPLASDAAMDILGGMLGYGTAMALAWPVRQWTRGQGPTQ